MTSCLRLGTEWDRLLDSWGVDCAFLRWDWVRTWLRVYGSSERLSIGVARDGAGAVVGLAPLVATRERVTPAGPRLRCVRILGDGPLCPDHLVLPVAPGRLAPFAEALLDVLSGRRAEWDRIELRDLLDEDPAWRAFETAARARGERVETRERTHCPYIPLPESWEEYLAGLSRHRRAAIRRGMRQLESDFKVELLEPHSIPDVDRMMGVLEDLHARAWQRRGEEGVFRDARFRLFHRLHARAAYRSGRLWLLCLEANGRPVAMSFGFRSRGSVMGYQHGYDPEYRDYGVGILVRAYGLRKAIGEGIREWDFLRGTTAYKYGFAGVHERRGRDLILHRGNVPDRAADAAARGRRLAGRALRRVLNDERVERLKRTLRLR